VSTVTTTTENRRCVGAHPLRQWCCRSAVGCEVVRFNIGDAGVEDASMQTPFSIAARLETVPIWVADGSVEQMGGEQLADNANISADDRRGHGQQHRHGQDASAIERARLDCLLTSCWSGFVSRMTYAMMSGRISCRITTGA